MCLIPFGVQKYQSRQYLAAHCCQKNEDGGSDIHMDAVNY